MSDQEPALLPPQLEPRRWPALPSVIVAVGLVAAAGAGMLGVGPHRDPLSLAPETTVAVTAGSSLVPIDVASPVELSRAMRTLRLDAEAKRAVHDEVMAGRLRLGALTVWDWKDEDGDEVIITSAGFGQVVPLGNRPTTVVIPYRGSGAMIAVTGLKDGENGITVGVSVAGEPTNLPPLYVGETVQVTIP